MRFAAPWLLAWRIARREARASAPKFVFVILGVAAGVGALTGVRGFADAFQEELRRQARTLLAADVSIRQFMALTPAQQQCLDSYVQRGVQLTRITETVSMMGAAGGVPVLVSVKAVDPAVYPFYGQVVLDPNRALKDALNDQSLAVSDDLLVRLNVQTGSMVKLGAAEFRLAGTVVREPDRMTGSLNIGPRVLVSRAGLERTGLLTFGSRASQRFLFRLPAPGSRQVVNLDAMRDELKRIFPEAMIADYRESHPAIRRALERGDVSQPGQPDRAGGRRAGRSDRDPCPHAAAPGLDRDHEMPGRAQLADHRHLHAAGGAAGARGRPRRDGGGLRRAAPDAAAAGPVLSL